MTNNLVLTVIAIVSWYLCVELAWTQIFNYFGFQIMKLDIPKFRYLFQDKDGVVVAAIKNTRPLKGHIFWDRGHTKLIVIANGNRNKNWRNTRIDLETDDYEFEDGILRRVDK